MYTREQKTEELPGVRLMSLLEKHLPAILDREVDNNNSIHLYGTGEYWVAFEKSAYQLSRVYPRSTTTPLSLTTYPFPIVMVSMTNSGLRACSGKYPFRMEGTDYGILVVHSLTIADYREWHNAEVMDFPMP